MAKEDGAAQDAVQYDLKRVTAREMHGFFKAARENDIVTLASVLTKVVVSCPWGDPSDPNTFLELPFYGAFQDAIEGLVNAAKNGVKI
jgi:hypothetical protein